MRLRRLAKRGHDEDTTKQSGALGQAEANQPVQTDIQRTAKSLCLTRDLTREKPTADRLSRGLKNGNLPKIMVACADTIVIQLNFDS